MNAPVKTPEERKAELQGMGDSRLRKEDARFIKVKASTVTILNSLACFTWISFAHPWRTDESRK